MAKYYIVDDNNLCVNIIVWDGDTSKWKPPVNTIVLNASTTPVFQWGLDDQLNDWVYIESYLTGSVGFTWDGNHLVTNKPKPPPLPVVTIPEVTETTDF